MAYADMTTSGRTSYEDGLTRIFCKLLVSGQESPIRPLEPSYTGGNLFGRFPSSASRSSDGIAPQLTGTTTIARQYSGMGALTSQLTGQLTGNGLSPTRQLPRDINRSPSPTKMMMMSTPGPVRRMAFPRPKSMISARGKSMDEGRGMFLVRQFTGGGTGDGDMGS
jgi:hypothetical protein